MKEADLNIALKTLREHIQHSKKRNTPEREAVLRAAYSHTARFTFEDIEKRLPEVYDFPISPATIYNALRLFIELGILRCIRQNSRTLYDISMTQNSCVQICRVCGKTTALDSKKAEKSIANIALKRFTREAFTLTIDGVCTSCKTKMNKAQTATKKKT